MKKLAKKLLCLTAVLALTLSLFTGCKSKNEKTLFEYAGQEVTFQEAHVYARIMQYQAEAQYGAYFGDSMWSMQVGTDSKGNKVRYNLTDDAKTDDSHRDWKFKTEFWTFNDDERPELPDPDSEYLELQLYLKSENSSENVTESSVTKEYVLDDDDDVYIEEENNVYDVADDYDSGWKAVGEKIRIDIR